MKKFKKRNRKEITQERESWTGGAPLGWRASNPMYVALASISCKKQNPAP